MMGLMRQNPSSIAAGRRHLDVRDGIVVDRPELGCRPKSTVIVMVPHFANSVSANMGRCPRETRRSPGAESLTRPSGHRSQ